MKLLIDIGHPAHVHLFKYVAWEMQRDGHEVLFTCREKEVVKSLLEYYKFTFISLGKHRSGAINKFTGLLRFDILLLRVARKFRPDILLSHGSFYAAHVAAFLRKPHISLEDTGNMEQIYLYRPFTMIILTPSCFHKELGRKQFRHRSYHELAYLAPSRFQPDPGIFSFLNLKPGEPYIILRFISWKASHDLVHKGIPDDYKLKIVQELSTYGKIFISSEKELPAELQKFSFRIPPEKMHDAMYFARLFIGESLTMVSECAMLGTPAIHVNTMTAGTLAEQEKYGLIFRFTNTEGLLEKIIELLQTKNLKEEWIRRRDSMLMDKIDITKLIVWILENYPESIDTLKQNTEYQQKFKFV